MLETPERAVAAAGRRDRKSADAGAAGRPVARRTENVRAMGGSSQTASGVSPPTASRPSRAAPNAAPTSPLRRRTSGRSRADASDLEPPVEAGTAADHVEFVDGAAGLEQRLESLAETVGDALERCDHEVGRRRVGPEADVGAARARIIVRRALSRQVRQEHRSRGTKASLLRCRSSGEHAVEARCRGSPVERARRRSASRTSGASVAGWHGRTHARPAPDWAESGRSRRR